jgi:hypothetical protein
LGDFLANYNTYLGNKKSLKFPVMCDGYVNIDYTKNALNTPYGIWGNTGSFTIQTIITPYDVNGCADGTTNGTGNGILTSEKTMPADAATGNWLGNSSMPVGTGSSTSTQDEHYLPLWRRFGREAGSQVRSFHKMTIMHNQNVELFLENVTTWNHNQPAEYRIGFTIRLDNDYTIKTPKVIIARNHPHDLSNVNDLYGGNTKNYEYIATGGTASGSSTILIPVTNSGQLFPPYNPLPVYDDTGSKIGTIAGGTAGGTHLHVTPESGYTYATFNSTSKKLYLEPQKEAIYLESIYHIAAAYEESTGRMSIFLNGGEIVSGVHNERSTVNTIFSFYNGNIYLGQNPLADVPRHTQFMGEIHELAITKNYQDNFNSLYTLLPQRRNLLMYLNFEEGDF